MHIVPEAVIDKVQDSPSHKNVKEVQGFEGLFFPPTWHSASTLTLIGKERAHIDWGSEQQVPLRRQKY